MRIKGETMTGTIAYDGEEAKRHANNLSRKSQECASAPDVQVTGGVNLDMTGVNQINAKLRKLTDVVNTNKRSYAGWMQDYADRLVQASRYGEVFEEGVVMQTKVRTQQVNDAAYTAGKEVVSKTSAALGALGFAVVDLS